MTIVAAVVAALPSVLADATQPQSIQIVVSQRSVQINGVQVRAGEKVGGVKYISLAALEKLVGPPSDTYSAGLGVTDYAWTSMGIHVQRGFRGRDKGKIFKFQVYLEDTYDRNEDKYSGKFTGLVCVDGLDIRPDTTFSSIRHKLAAQNYEIAEYPNVIRAENGAIRIFTVDKADKISRIEFWCL